MERELGLMCVHAHPDDECIMTGGVLLRAAEDGIRTAVVTCTGGERGEIYNMDEAEVRPRLAAVRDEELRKSLAILGAGEPRHLGYVDSGMMGTDTNELPESFWQAEVEEAAKRLAVILEAEAADVLTIYDDNGNYGHPDHIQVYRVGLRAAELAGTPDVFEATMNREAVQRMVQEAIEAGEQTPGGDDLSEIELGVPEAMLTTAVDVTPFLDRKRQAMAAHASQISESSWFLTMSPEAFARAFGCEWFVHRGEPAGIHEDWIL